MKQKERLIPVMLGILVGALLLGAMFVGCTDEIPPVKVDSIVVSMLPTTTEYWSGEYLDPKGLVLSVAMSDGTTSLVPWSKSSGITLSPGTDEVMNGAGDKTIDVTYESKETSFEVYVENSPVASLAITTQPSDLDYDVNETFDPSGLVLEATMDDGTHKTLSWSNSSEDLTLYPASGTTFTESGTQYVKVLYQGVAASVSVDVYDVYVPGYSTSFGSFGTAGYWKNGVFHILGDGASSSWAYDMALDASGRVHVVGVEDSKPCYWKPDGTKVSLSDNQGSATCIYIDDDGNMYAGGYIKGFNSGYANVAQGGYWDLSTLEFTSLSSNRSSDSAIYCLGEDSSGNFYKAGYQFTNDGKSIGTYYDNTNTPVLCGAITGSSIRNMIEGDNGVMYFGGFNDKSGNVGAGYWRSLANPTGTGNNFYKTISDPADYSYMYAIDMAKDSEGDFYVAGYAKLNGSTTYTAGYWKPDSNSATGYTFVALSDGTSDTRCYGISINDAGDKYITQIKVGAGGRWSAGYWKNETFVQLYSNDYISSAEVSNVPSQAVWRYKK